MKENRVRLRNTYIYIYIIKKKKKKKRTRCISPTASPGSRESLDSRPCYRLHMVGQGLGTQTQNTHNDTHTHIGRAKNNKQERNHQTHTEKASNRKKNIKKQNNTTYTHKIHTQQTYTTNKKEHIKHLRHAQHTHTHTHITRTQTHTNTKTHKQTKHLDETQTHNKVHTTGSHTSNTHTHKTSLTQVQNRCIGFLQYHPDSERETRSCN